MTLYNLVGTTAAPLYDGITGEYIYMEEIEGKYRDREIISLEPCRKGGEYAFKVWLEQEIENE